MRILYRKWLSLVAAAFGLLSLSTAGATTSSVVVVNSILDLRGLTYTLATDGDVYVASYYCNGSPACKPDGGEGLFVNAGPVLCPDDNGSVIKETMSGGVCFYRQNMKGDLRQWGVTKDSIYDANSPINTPPVTDATDRMNSAFTSLGNRGITELSTYQVSIYLAGGLSGSNITIPINASLACGATGGGQYAGGIYSGQPGTIYIRHGFYINGGSGTSQVDGSSIHNCIILPEWLQVPSQAVSDCSAPSDGGSPNLGQSFSYPPTTYPDLEKIRADMVICADTAILFNGSSGNRPHDLWIYGFDTPLSLFKNDHFILTNAMIDGNVCVYSQAGGGITKVNETTCEPFLTRQVTFSSHTDKNTCINNDPNGDTLCNSEYWQIESITNSPTTVNSYGRPVCEIRLTSGVANGKWKANSPPSPTDLVGVTSLRNAIPLNEGGNTNAKGDAVSYPMWLGNLNASTGGLGCVGRGPHPIVSVSSGTDMWGPYVVLDLLESEFGTGAYPITAAALWSACTTPPCAIRIISGDVDAMAAGETVVGTDIPTSARITNVVRSAKGADPNDGYIAEIFVNVPLPTAHATSPDVALTIDGGAFTAFNHSFLCDDGHQGQCAFVDAAQRFLSGAPQASPPTAPTGLWPGDAVSMLPESNGHHYSAAFMNNGTAGLCMFEPFSYGHHYGFAIQDANSSCVVNKDGDDNGELDDQGAQFFVISGNSNQLSAQGIGSGGVGVGIVNDLYAMSDNPNGTQTTITTSIGATGIGTANTGLLVGVADTSVLLTDQGPGALNGHGMAGLCTQLNNTTNTCKSVEEYVTFEIVTPGAPGQILLTARGQRFTLPATYAINTFLVPTTVTRPTGCDSFSSTTAPVTAPDLNSIEQVGGCLQLANFKFPEAKNVFIGHNATSTEISNAALPQAAFFYEDATALGSVTGCGNQLLVPAVWNCPQPLAHGQVYLSSASMDSELELCPSNGSGLNINNQLVSVPLGCLLLQKASAITGLNYIYAANTLLAVSNVTSDSGLIQIATQDALPFKLNDQIQVTCYGINGVGAANMTGLATVKGTNSFDFTGSSFSGAYTYGGSCTLMGLVASATGHSTAKNGVETKNGDATLTLVGAGKLDGTSGLFLDSPSQRDVSSWFNRQPGSCFASLPHDTTVTTAAMTYTQVGTISCEFLRLGPGNVAWAVAGAAESGILTTTTVKFDTGMPENQFTAGASTTGFPISVSGSKSLNEQVHTMILLTFTPSAGSPDYLKGSSIEVRVQQ